MKTGSKLELQGGQNEAFIFIKVSELTLPDFVWDLEYASHYLYVAAGDGGLRIIDVTDPVNPLKSDILTLHFMLRVFV